MTRDSSTTHDEARIRAVIDGLTLALHAKNADAVTRHYAEDFVQFSLAPPLVSDAANEGGLNAWFATWQGPIDCEVHDLSILMAGDVAFCHNLNRMRGTKTDGENVDLWFRQTLGFEKRAGAWKIVHEHESVPFYMDGSYKAAVDLKP
jgi:PhnB protein